jgi:transcriptional regulator with AAA-type ATPase domain
MSLLKTIAAELVEFVSGGIAPVYVLDDARRIVYCNTACARWASVKISELVGQQCAFHSPEEQDGPAAIAAGLCPPPKVFAGQARSALVSCRRSDGNVVRRLGHFFPLDDGQDESSPVLVVLDQHDASPALASPADGQGDDVSPELQLHEQLRRLRLLMAGRFHADSLLGNHPWIVRARAQIALAAQTRANVLCAGPRGTGKAHAAKAIHYSQRESGHFVPLSCAVLEPNSLRASLRSLWLKHSATTGQASTVLLEDVDRLPAEAQEELVGLLRSASTAVRVIATTDKPMAELIGESEFSGELAGLLSTITIELPPLDERSDDIPLLAQAFLEDANAEGIKQLGGFSTDALDQMLVYPWPGNVDELRALVREAHDRARGGEVTARDLPEKIEWTADATAHPRRSDDPIVLEEFLAGVEKELITRALRRAKGNKSKAARLLGLTRPRLYRRLIQLGLEKATGKSSDAKP